MNWASLDQGILGPAFLAGLIVLSTHIPLGRRVLERGIIFIDLAIAQIAGLGVIAAHALESEPKSLAVQVAAFGAATTGALALYLAERRRPDLQEAIIGSIFVLAASAAILLLANDPHGGEHLKNLLVGQILWIDLPYLMPPALLSILVLLTWFLLKAARSTAAFYILFAVSITASVQLVGIYLVFASLIIPALGARCYPAGRQLFVAAITGTLGYAGGLALSALYDLPSGPVIVWMLAMTALLGAWMSRLRLFRP
ncbi:MAG: metal ABC transporter permease [gamma proteobacterium endosymbiont of Lamellibrachia anaximandri]|nr:metal ABC transporter permease [gamma proteobacterium endosymbiont of Lamellibrachia anaximandri]MBL3534542.1 metal ABC transporter permease [gamma proteobacterium endosymbiont of Lamellibrachia anaximandri]